MNLRKLYMLASYLLIPYLAISALRHRDYRVRWRERLGFYRQHVEAGGIVVHAASVGEVNAAAPLIRAMKLRFPALPITVTCFTPTGSARVVALFGHEVHHVFAPLDFPGAVKRFCRNAKPRLLVIIETEIWPNLYFAAAQEGIPILMANARVSKTSFKAYQRLRRLTGAALAQVNSIAAQSGEDASRLREIGAPADRIEVTGNLKFDLKLPDELRQQGSRLRRNWGEMRPVLLAASTHEGDEGPLLAAFPGLLQSHPQALLVLAPRHPHRFERAAQRVRAAGLTVQLHSDGLPCRPETQCVVVDAMGVLLACYAACDVAFVGGSLDRVGGHNVLEPAALSIPVLLGPHTFNFEDTTRALLASGGARCVNDATELERAAVELLGDPEQRRQMGAAGLGLLRDGQGAVSRTLHIIAEMMNQSSN